MSVWTTTTTNAVISATTSSAATTAPVVMVTTWTRTITLVWVRITFSNLSARPHTTNDESRGTKLKYEVKTRNGRSRSGQSGRKGDWYPFFFIYENYEEFKWSFVIPNAVSCAEDLLGIKTGDIPSPSWPGTYAENANCKYTLSVEENLQLELHFLEDFDVEQGPDGHCIDELRVRIESQY